MDNLSNISNGSKISNNNHNNNNLFNSTNFDDFLNLNGNSYSFDHNPEADYLLSNINTPTNSSFNNNNLLNMSRFEGWINQNPLYKFPNEDNYNSYQINENSKHELLLKYLNGVEFDKSLQPFEDYKFLDYLIGDKVKNESKQDNLQEINLKEKLMSFDDQNNSLNNPVNTRTQLNSLNNNVSSNDSKSENSSYITEGTGTIMKIIEATQLWLKHTSSDKIPIKLKKQFTKNDNFVVLIKKQCNH